MGFAIEMAGTQILLYPRVHIDRNLDSEVGPGFQPRHSIWDVVSQARLKLLHQVFSLAFESSLKNSYGAVHSK